MRARGRERKRIYRNVKIEGRKERPSQGDGWSDGRKETQGARKKSVEKERGTEI